MHRRSNTYTYLLFIATLALIASCATNAITPSDATLSGDPEAMWIDGQSMAKRGEAKIDKGEKVLSEGRKQINKGQQSIQTGNAEVAASRMQYQNAVRVAGNATTAKMVTEESKLLKKIGAEWQQGIDAIRSGNKLVEKGNANVEQGQVLVREGRKFLEEGSNLMRRSQQLRMDKPE